MGHLLGHPVLFMEIKSSCYRDWKRNCVIFCWGSLNYNFEMNFIHSLNVWHLVLIYELKFQAHNKVSVLLGTLLNSSTSSWNSFEILMKYFIWVIQDLQANTKASFTGNIRCFIIEDKMQNHYQQNFGHQFSFRWEPEPILVRDIFHSLTGPCDSTKTLKKYFQALKVFLHFDQLSRRLSWR